MCISVLLSLDVVPLNAVNLEQVVKLVCIVFVFSVVRIPNLCKERICSCNFVIIPSLLRNITLRTPVTAEEDKCR